MYDINRLAKVWHMPNEFAEAFVFLLENEFPKDYLEKEYNGNLEDIYFEDEIPDRLYILPHFAADLILYKDIEDVIEFIQSTYDYDTPEYEDIKADIIDQQDESSGSVSVDDEVIYYMWLNY